MDQWRHLQRKWGTSVQPLKNADNAYSISALLFVDKNKQLTLLSQCKLAFTGTGRNTLTAMEIRRDIKKHKKNRRDTYSGLDLSIYVIKAQSSS
jgi:hypothetical protein